MSAVRVPITSEIMKAKVLSGISLERDGGSRAICRSASLKSATDAQVYVAAGIVRWVRGQEFGLETLVMDEESRMDLYSYLSECIAE